MLQLSGNNQLKIPEANPFGFVFNSISVLTTGVSSISFANASGTSISFILSGQNIYLKSSGINKCISSYNTGQSFSLSGTYLSGNSGYYFMDFYVRDLHINSWQELLPSNLFLLNINVASGDLLNIDAQMYCNTINSSLNLPFSYEAFSNFTGNIITNTNYWILGSNTTYINSYQSLLSTDNIIAPVKTTLPLILNINDLDNSYQDYQVKSQSYLTTNIGSSVLTGNIYRSGNEENILDTFELLNTTSNISGLFNGIWSGETFIYSDFPEYLTLNFEFSEMNISGIYSTNQNIFINFQPYLPLNNQTYYSEYITGFVLTNSGNYVNPPTVMFNNYYFTTGMTQQWATMLFSSGCSGNIPFYTTGGGGTGASGIIQVLPVTLSNLYVVGNAIYNIVTGTSMYSSGTNYTGIPNIIIQTGIYSNCYDVPTHYGTNLYSFTPINTSGAISPQAQWLTGIVLTTTGVTGNYYVTGLEVTNIGYGYNASRTPYCTFIRSSGDSMTTNASGFFQLKATGLYNINNYWTIYTGWTNQSVSPLVSGLSGILSANERFFSIVLQCSGLDNTSGIVSQLTIQPSLGSGITQLITGTKYYTGDPYFLKKKLNPELLLVPVSGQLSFLSSQSDLDNYYANFTASPGINVGDLNF